MTFDSRCITSPLAFTLAGLLAAACGAEGDGNSGTQLQREEGTVATPTSPAPVTPTPITPSPTPVVTTPQPTTTTPAPVVPTPVAPQPVTPPVTPAQPPAPTTTAAPTTPPPAPTTPSEPTSATSEPDPTAPPTESGFGTPQYTGSGSAQGVNSPGNAGRYQKADVTRNGVNYFFMANGWGPGFQNQDVSWNGTSFTVESMNGSPGGNYEPASYPTMFCGAYSDSVSKECGLPAAIADIQTLRTGWRWKANGNTSDYNSAYDIWVGNGTTRNSFSGYLMVWLRDPPGQQPAGQPDPAHLGVTVDGVPGTWDVWTGEVNRAPIINWVKAEGQDISELEFDVMDFVRDAPKRGFTVPGTHILSVAVGFEIWEGPVTNLVSEDFYVDVVKK